jgi:carboxypeptidase T
MPHRHVTVRGAGREAMADLVREHGITVYAQTLSDDGDRSSVRASLSDDDAARLERAGYEVERHEDVPEPGTAPAADRYLTVDEVDAAVTDLAATHPDIVEVVELPHETWEGRRVCALRLHPSTTGSGSAPHRVVLLGGVHAREWGSPDILINLVRRLAAAWAGGSGVDQGGASFDAADVASVVQGCELVVLPLVNPDGRHHSMTVDPMWRKNRRPDADAGCEVGDGDGPGVDINRNFDFLWDFRHRFSAQAPVRTSTDPCSAVYAGPTVTSEPETQNVVALFERYAPLDAVVDVHSFGEDILYGWGDDNGQTGDPGQNFDNPAYDRVRGIPDGEPDGAAYREYLARPDRDRAVALGTAMSDAITAAHGRSYTVKESVDLYPTSGTTNDHACAHGMTDGRARTLGFCVEWGPQRPSVAESFHPRYADMVPIIEEVTAGLLAFSLEAVRVGAVPQP